MAQPATQRMFPLWIGEDGVATDRGIGWVQPTSVCERCGFLHEHDRFADPEATAAIDQCIAESED